MNWPDFFLICFLVGFLLSIISLLTGHIHLPLHHAHVHVPHGHVHVPHAHAGGTPHAAHLPQGGGGHGAAAQSAPQQQSQSDVPWLNFGTIAAFLTWFGGSGYLATHYYGALVATAVIISLGFGLFGASVVFFFLARVLMGRPEHMDPADYDMVGVLGTVSAGIRIGGVGEILFSQQGARKAIGARSEDGAAIPNGVEVVVTKYENGIAYVRRWDELTGPSMELKKES